MLNPNDRKIYLDELSPPMGYRLDCAIATTFSLDLLTLLMAPLSMALYQFRNKDEMLNDPSALLEALHQTADRFAVFCQNGRISVPAKDTLLYSYLEKAVISVNGPNSEGVFHPKTWLLRFEAEEEKLQVFYRFLCLSRNLTFDRSWDTVLTLEGRLEDRRKLGYSRNRPLTEFIKVLPELAVNPPNPEILKIIKIMTREVPRVRFTTPEGFDSNFRFFPIGIPGHFRFPKIGARKRTFVLSPFIAFSALKQLTDQGRNNIIISRLEELTDLSNSAYNFLQQSSRLFFMDSGVERPEETHPEEQNEHASGEHGNFSGLHAKLIITENASQAIIWTGSANVTNPALRGQNVEFIVKLSGPSNKVGINKFLGGESDRLSFMSMLRPYERESDLPPVDPTLKKLEKMLETARRVIADAGLKVDVQRQIGGEYRNTKEIAEFAANFIGKSKEKSDNQKVGGQELFADYFDFQGPKPEIKQFADFKKITAYVADKIAEIVETDGCPFSEIAVLYAMKHPSKDLKTPLPHLIEKALESKGILNNWVSQDYRSKKTYDITTNSATISTIHSVKGLDYSTVFLLALDFLEPREWSEEQLDRLTYVAITRARYQLFIPYINQSELIKNLVSSL